MDGYGYFYCDRLPYCVVYFLSGNSKIVSGIRDWETVYLSKPTITHRETLPPQSSG